MTVSAKIEKRIRCDSEFTHAHCLVIVPGYSMQKYTYNIPLVSVWWFILLFQCCIP